MKKHSPGSSTVRMVRPEEPEARDEGPRLLPLSEEQRRETRLDHYITLANLALGIPPGDKTARPPRKPNSAKYQRGIS